MAFALQKRSRLMKLDDGFKLERMVGMSFCRLGPSLVRMSRGGTVDFSPSTGG